MSLRNALIDPGELAPAEPLRLTPVATAYARYRLLALSLRWLVAATLAWTAVSEVARDEPMLALWPVALTALALLHLACAWREARSRAWGVRDHDLLYASGLIQRRLTVLPCNRIQHVETASGPLERHFDLLRVTCFTAGGLSADLVIRGLATADAERVRQYLLGRIHEADGDTVDPAVQELQPDPDPATS
ncbi:MAG: PH domain-containing protein [Gammaproteobacteria bacterium]|nr:PH domain-containing protein [Gammaproteobacteria bacterium]